MWGWNLSLEKNNELNMNILDNICENRFIYKGFELYAACTAILLIITIVITIYVIVVMIVITINSKNLAQ